MLSLLVYSRLVSTIHVFGLATIAPNKLLVSFPVIIVVVLSSQIIFILPLFSFTIFVYSRIVLTCKHF